MKKPPRSSITALSDVDEGRYELIARGANDGIWDLDLESGEIFVSARWLEVAGVDEPPTTFEEWLEFIHPADRDLAKQATLAHLSGNTDHLEIEMRLGSDPAEPRWVLLRGLADGNDPPRRMAGSITDTSNTHQTEHRLRQQAFHDPLTGLPNRTFLIEELNRHRGLEQRYSSSGIAVLFLDLVGFKRINDHFGHDVGDEVLRTIGTRLRVATRPEDLATRLGGDEFVVVMAAIDSVEGALGVANRLVDQLRQPIQAGGAQHEIVPSAGLAVTADNSWSPEGLIRQADAAMYRAKRRGSDRVEAHLVARATDEAAVPPVRSLRAAASEGRLLLHYQPIVALADMSIVAYEALLRWRRPGRGIVPAYSSGVEIDPVLDSELSAWALTHAIDEAGAAGSAVPRLNINVSRMHLVGSEFTHQVDDWLTSHEIDPRWLRLELAADALDGLDLDVLRPLRSLGIGIHLDDFGAGDASLRLLLETEPDAVKISGSLTSALLTDPAAAKLIQAISAAAISAGIPLIGTHLEVPATARALQEFGFTLGQGNLFAPPEPPNAAFAMTDAQPAASVAASMLG